MPHVTKQIKLKWMTLSQAVSVVLLGVIKTCGLDYRYGTTRQREEQHMDSVYTFILEILFQCG